MIHKNIRSLQKKVENTLVNCGRPKDDISIVMVTKTQSIDTISKALNFDIKKIGENKVQEAKEKLPFLEYDEFHFIGHLQSNKINKLLSLNPHLIHSIDKFSTAQKLSAALQKLDRQQDILVQINTSGESSKSGVFKEKGKELVLQIAELPNLRVLGLMTIGSLSYDINDTKECFRYLKKLFEDLKSAKEVQMKYLSMGMSGDWELAIQEGSNMIRVGSTIFGKREY